jgi:hypothetical protein
MKKFIIAVVLLLVVAAGTAYYFYGKVSYQPDWYLENNTTGQDLLTGNIDAFERKIMTDLKNGKSVKIPANRIVALMANQLEKKTGFEIRKAIKAAKTTITSGKVEVEMIVDVPRMPPDNLPANAQKALDQFLKMVPENALNNLFLKCNLTPEKQENTVSFDPASNFSIGKMNIPMEKLKEKLGSKRKLSLKSFPVSDFKLKDNAILLKP